MLFPTIRNPYTRQRANCAKSLARILCNLDVFQIRQFPYNSLCCVDLVSGDLEVFTPENKYNNKISHYEGKINPFMYDHVDYCTNTRIYQHSYGKYRTIDYDSALRNLCAIGVSLPHIFMCAQFVSDSHRMKFIRETTKKYNVKLYGIH